MSKRRTGLSMRGSPLLEPLEKMRKVGPGTDPEAWAHAVCKASRRAHIEMWTRKPTTTEARDLHDVLAELARVIHAHKPGSVYGRNVASRAENAMRYLRGGTPLLVPLATEDESSVVRHRVQVARRLAKKAVSRAAARLLEPLPRESQLDRQKPLASRRGGTSAMSWESALVALAVGATDLVCRCPYAMSIQGRVLGCALAMEVYESCVRLATAMQSVATEMAVESEADLPTLLEMMGYVQSLLADLAASASGDRMGLLAQIARKDQGFIGQCAKSLLEDLRLLPGRVARDVLMGMDDLAVRLRREHATSRQIPVAEQQEVRAVIIGGGEYLRVTAESMRSGPVVIARRLWEAMREAWAEDTINIEVACR